MELKTKLVYGSRRRAGTTTVIRLVLGVGRRLAGQLLQEFFHIFRVGIIGIDFQHP